MSAVGEGNGLGIGIAVHSPSTPNLYGDGDRGFGSKDRGLGSNGNGKGVLREKSSYESLGVMDERDYGRGYGGGAAEIQQPTRARTLSFGEHGHIG